MRITRSIVPNFFTLMNLFSGFNAIVCIANSDYIRASLFILVAAIFDTLDGAMARLVKSASEFGVELDSLCDAVSFGVAPSFMLYKVYFYQFADFGVVVSSLPALAGVVRLARFNVRLTSFEDKNYFTGMPIPAGALLVVSYVIFFHLRNLVPANMRDIAIFLVPVIASLAMVSTIKYDNMPKPTKKAFKQRPLIFIFFLTGLIVCIVSKGVLIFPFMIVYLFFGAVRHTIYWLKKKREAADDIDETDEETIDIYE